MTGWRVPALGSSAQLYQLPVLGSQHTVRNWGPSHLDSQGLTQEQTVWAQVFTHIDMRERSMPLFSRGGNPLQRIGRGDPPPLRSFQISLSNPRALHYLVAVTSVHLIHTLPRHSSPDCAQLVPPQGFMLAVPSPCDILQIFTCFSPSPHVSAQIAPHQLPSMSFLKKTIFLLST